MKQWRPSAKGLAQVACVAVLFAASVARAEKDCSQMTAQAGPAWLRDGVIYEIFPRDFSPAGNFNGVTARLDDLKGLGVNILWIMPIHPIGTKGRKGEYGSPYSVSDYYAVNPDYGTLADFKRLVSEAHKRDLKVIMDVVINHTSWDSVLMRHPEFYKQDNNGKIIPPVPEWTDVAGLNYDSPALRTYMIGMLKYWLQTCDVDGFRCDVAYMVPTDFWEEARTELQKIKPDIMFLAEASKPELLVNAFDIDYSWSLLSTMNNVLTQGAPAADVSHNWEETRRQFPRGALHMRISDDHDESRATARYGLRGSLAASALMFTLDGVPLLYNGMEVGDATESGDPALFVKQAIFWTPRDRPPMKSIYKDLIRLRRQHACFRNDHVNWLTVSDDNDLIAFTRSDDTEEFLVVINFSNRPVTGSVDVAKNAEFRPVRIAGMPDTPAGDLAQLRLKGYEWRIYSRSLTHP
jgi:cyclomaltodextrinase / maltogenic alpha-amylase / neopullulanase